MSNRRIVILVMLLAITPIGCAKSPFRETPRPKLTQADPAAIVDDFTQSLSPRFTSDDTVIIHAPFRDDMAILGVLKVDRAAGTFELLGLNHVGVQLFHLSGDRDGSHIRSAIPPLMEHKQILLSIADDTRRMYFDLTPSDRDRASVKSTTVRFSEKTPQGTLIHEFGGDPTVLLEKRLTGLLGTKWRVRYFEYAAKDGKPHPRGIILNNGHYHYRITVRNRDWQAQ
jgi:hypothetical protein